MNTCSRNTFEETWHRRNKLLLRGGEWRVYELDGGRERSLVSHIPRVYALTKGVVRFEEEINKALILIRGNNKEGIYMYKESLDCTSCLVSREGEDNRKNFFFPGGSWPDLTINSTIYGWGGGDGWDGERKMRVAGSEGNARTWTDRIDHFSSIFFFKRSPVWERKEEKRRGRMFDSIRFDSTRFQVLDDKAALTKKNSAEWNQLIGAVLSCGESWGGTKKDFALTRFERWKNFTYVYIHAYTWQESIKRGNRKRNSKKKKKNEVSLDREFYYTRTRIRFYLLLCQFIKRKQKTKKIPIFL